MSSEESTQRVTVDACGTFCPVPILELAKVARRSQPGTRIELLATDPAVEGDVRAWCASTGHLVVSQTRVGARFHALIHLR